MYVYIYIYIYTYIYTYIHTFIHIYIHIYIYTSIHLYMYTYIYIIYIHTYLHPDIYIFTSRSHKKYVRKSYRYAELSEQIMLMNLKSGMFPEIICGLLRIHEDLPEGQ